MKRFDILVIAALAATLSACRHDVEFDACGQIDAEQVTVSAEAAGRIISLDLKEGDALVAGQMVGAVDSVQTALQISELEQRRDGARSRLIDIAAQQAPQKQQLASLENDYRRFSALLKSDAATQKQVDDISSQIDILKSQIAAQKQTWERNNSSVQSEISTYEIQLAQKRDQLAKCRICSPVSGTVLTKYADEGESVTVFAEVEGAYEISEAAELSALDVHHMWTPEYAESRFKWRPKKPLTVLVLRAYLLPEKVELPYRDEYGGCKSWIGLQESVSVEGARAALSDEDFDRLVAPALRVLERFERAPVGS